MSRELGIGLVGLGYWGKNHFRILRELYEDEFLAVCDKRINFLAKEIKIPSYLKTYKLFDEFVKDEEVNTIVIATPAKTHYELVKKGLENGKDILVEKPLTLNYENAVELRDIAKSYNRILMVGHVYCFNPLVKYIKSLIKNKTLGRLMYGIAIRIGLGPIRNDADCIADLATHDISIADYIFDGNLPLMVSASAFNFLPHAVYDYSTLNLLYPEDFHLNIISSWYSPEKIRTWEIVGSKKMIKFDDAGKKIYLFNKSFVIEEKNEYPMFKIKDGKIEIPTIEYQEPLKLELMHFIECVKERKKPLTDVEQGMRVVKIIECAKKSIKKNSSWVRVE